MFEKFADFAQSWTAWATVIVLAVFAAAMIVVMRKNPKWTTQMLTNAALCLALSFILSYIKLFELPQGGSVTCASLLPVIAFAYAYGLAPGLVVGFAYGLLQMIQDPWIVGFTQAMLDYPIAFGAIGLAGLAHKLPSKYGFVVGIVLVGIVRFVCHTVSGVVFFASYAEGTGLSPLVYSLSYNSFVFVDLGIDLVVIAIPAVRRALDRMRPAPVTHAAQ